MISKTFSARGQMPGKTAGVEVQRNDPRSYQVFEVVVGLDASLRQAAQSEGPLLWVGLFAEVRVDTAPFRRRSAHKDPLVFWCGHWLLSTAPPKNIVHVIFAPLR